MSLANEPSCGLEKWVIMREDKAVIIELSEEDVMEGRGWWDETGWDGLEP